MLHANASLMGTSDDLIGNIISTKIILSLMGSPGHVDGLEEENHASRAGHFFPSYMPRYSCPMDSLVPLPDPFLNYFCSTIYFPATSSHSVPPCEMPLPAIL